jgi:hypothetical protein
MKNSKSSTPNPQRDVYTAKFRLGQTVMTPGARDTLDQHDILTALGRHAQGDWGDCGEDDRNENDLSLDAGLRIFSVYKDRFDTKFWIITEADRSATTVLLPSGAP